MMIRCSRSSSARLSSAWTASFPNLERVVSLPERVGGVVVATYDYAPMNYFCADGTRELVVTGTPYIVAYTVLDNRVEILAVQHGAQEWPERY